MQSVHAPEQVDAWLIQSVSVAANWMSCVDAHWVSMHVHVGANWEMAEGSQIACVDAEWLSVLVPVQGECLLCAHNLFVHAKTRVAV